MKTIYSQLSLARKSSRNCLLLALGVWSAWIAAVHGQSYSFTTIAGMAGVSGTNDGANGEARFFCPSELTVDRAGVIYVSDMLNHAIRKITPVGTNWVVSTVAGLPGAVGAADGTNSDARFDRPVGVKVDGQGNLFVADLYNHTIRKIAPIGTNWVVTTIAGLAAVHGSSDGTNSDARFWSPRGVAVDSSNRVYVVDSANFTIRGITPFGTNWVVTTLAGLALSYGFADGKNERARFNTPFGITADSDGRLFVADFGNDAIRQITPVGTDWVTATIAGFSGTMGTNDGSGRQAMFNFPNGIDVDRGGNVYLTDQSNHTIRKMAPAGNGWTVSTLGGAPLVSGSADGTGGDARFNRPWGIAVDGAGNLFIADYLNHTIRKGTLLLPPVPALGIAEISNEVVLSWPAATTNFVLETAGGLAAGVPWTALTNGVVVSGENCFVTNSVGGPAAFYRLRKQ
jgi:sugar lactone lactonase YvrE